MKKIIALMAVLVLVLANAASAGACGGGAKAIDAEVADEETLETDA